MGVTQYIGARYVPLFADPAEWTKTRTYEPLTIVLHNGNSFTSKQFVPLGIDILNTDYWAETGNYNAQVEQYRQEVLRFDGRITANTEAIAEEAKTRKEKDDAIVTRLDNLETTTGTLGTASKKDWTNQIVSKGTDLPTSGAVYTAIDDAIEKATNKVTVLVGDSWTDTGYLATNWPAYFSLPNRTIKNYAKANACYTEHESRNIMTNLLSNAINDGSFDNSQVAEVISIAGLNDFRDGKAEQAVADRIGQYINKIKSNFPNAKMYFAMDFQYPFTNADLNWYYRVQRIVAYQNGIMVVPLIGTVLSSANTWNDTLYHLQENGSRQLAACIYAMVTGSEIERQAFRVSVNDETDTVTYQMLPVFTTNGLIVHERLTLNKDITSFPATFKFNVSARTWNFINTYRRSYYGVMRDNIVACTSAGTTRGPNNLIDSFSIQLSQQKEGAESKGISQGETLENNYVAIVVTS